MILLALTVLRSAGTKAQTYFTKNGNVSFFSKTVLENIDATNDQVLSVINFQSGSIQFSLLSNAFHFEKAKMEDDFNEDYIESNKYPRATFKGTMEGITNVDLTRDGTHPITAKGDLTIHGVTKNVVIPGSITIKDGNLSVASSFKILVKDYKIDVPSIVVNKIAETIEVRVRCNYEKK
jgi:hypothetical protein